MTEQHNPNAKSGSYTVAELIEKLQEFPEDARVEFDVGYPLYCNGLFGKIKEEKPVVTFKLE